MAQSVKMVKGTASRADRWKRSGIFNNSMFDSCFFFLNENVSWKSEPDPQLISRDREVKQVFANRSLRLELWLLTFRYFSTTGLELHYKSSLNTYTNMIRG